MAEANTSGTELSPEEMSQRVAILKRLREHLLGQKQKFQDYLKVLENQENSILEEDIERLEVQVQAEQSIVKEIFAFQKVIDPLEEMYRHAYPQKEDEIPQLKESLVRLQQEVLRRNADNRKLIRERMDTLRQKIDSLKLPRNKLHSPYGDVKAPSFIDITT